MTAKHTHHFSVQINAMADGSRQAWIKALAITCECPLYADVDRFGERLVREGTADSFVWLGPDPTDKARWLAGSERGVTYRMFRLDGSGARWQVEAAHGRLLGTVQLGPQGWTPQLHDGELRPCPTKHDAAGYLIRYLLGQGCQL